VTRPRWRSRLGEGLRALADALDAHPHDPPSARGLTVSPPLPPVPSVGSPGMLDLAHAPADWAARVSHPGRRASRGLTTTYDAPGRAGGQIQAAALPGWPPARPGSVGRRPRGN